jgi:hypothetical protein
MQELITAKSRPPAEVDSVVTPLGQVVDLLYLTGDDQQPFQCDCPEPQCPASSADAR